MHKLSKKKKKALEPETPVGKDLDNPSSIQNGPEPFDMEEQFLCLTVKEARGLMGKNHETHSSDP
jgi:hypothetical protein